MRFFAIADGVLLAVCLLVGLLLRWVLRRVEPPPASLGRSPWRSAAEGALLAVALLAATVLPSAVAGGYRTGPDWHAFPNAAEPVGLAVTWLFFAVQSLLEELVFRGIAMTVIAALSFAIVRLVLRRWGADRPPGPVHWAWFGTGLFVNVFVSVFFGFVHADNPNATPVAVLNVVLISIVLGQLVWTRASILGAWTLHWVWNALVVTLGFPISGVRIAPPFAEFGVAGARDGLLTGGQFGPEGALTCTIALAVFLCALVSSSIHDLRATIPGDDAWHAPDPEDILVHGSENCSTNDCEGNDPCASNESSSR